jgi:fatty acid desaturase
MTDVQNSNTESAAKLEKARRFGRMNLLVITAQVIAWASLIFVLHGDIGLWFKALTLILFCLMMQGVFSFMHECFHHHAHPNARINWFTGWLSSTIFGTSYTLFRINHLGHHVRNRTRAELVDYVYPDESPLRKFVIYYTGILGGIWLGGLVGSIVLPLLPFGLARALEARSEDNTYLTAFKDFSPRDWNMMRLELALGVIFWVSAIQVFNWDWRPLLVAYAAFAFSWSLLQWVYHVRAPIDVVEGAYNLRVPTPIRWLFLNFNYNLTHHRDASYHWQELHDVSNQDEMQPLWYRLIRMALPPQRLPDDPSTITKSYF